MRTRKKKEIGFVKKKMIFEKLKDPFFEVV
jgi:hypothetical protein